MEFKFIELHEKLEKIDAMISEEELEFMHKEYEGLLAIEEKVAKPRKKEMLRLHGMVCFLGAWGIMKRDRQDF